MMPNISEDVWISVATAARILEKTPQMVRLYAEQGKVRSRRIGGPVHLHARARDIFQEDT